MATGKHTLKTASDALVTEPVAAGGDNLVKPTYKVRIGVKALAFVVTVVSLSWFFEGWRQVAREATLAHVGVLVAGVAFTLGLLGVQAYWIYVEEKVKGTLKRRIGLFERIYSSFDRSVSEAGSARLSGHSRPGGSCCAHDHEGAVRAQKRLMGNDNGEKH